MNLEQTKLSSQLARWLGDLSFGVYLFHKPVFYFYAFARLVSRFRRDDARRLAYLCADERRRTEMLVRECPFLAAIAPG